MSRVALNQVKKRTLSVSIEADMLLAWIQAVQKTLSRLERRQKKRKHTNVNDDDDYVVYSISKGTGTDDLP
jgi:hypothetical protein